MKHSFVDSPLGLLLLVGDRDGLAGLYPPEHVRLPVPDGDRDDTLFTQAREELGQYFAGDRTEFETPLNPIGTEFQRAVWAGLRTIAYGDTVSYRELATSIGRPSAVRAVGLANGRNPISIVVPCHRVVGSTGQLTGYAGGLAAKAWLLEHERRHHPAVSA
jgi:methylated-DNA-[protein]-cysteine S-methyltransferase